MYDPNRKNARSQQWNFEVQRQMSKDLLLSVAYVGSHSDRLPVTGLFNVSPVPGLGAAGVPYPWATTEFMEESIGGSRYNALQAKLEKRYSSGLQFLVSYSWSKVLENGGSGVFGAENGPGGSSAVQNLYNLSSNWGVAAYDIPQYFSAAITYDLPIGKGKPWLNRSGPLSYILGNWQVNTVTTLRSGQPFNLDVQGDAANIGNNVGFFNYERPNLIGNPYVSNPTANMYYNPAAFAIPVNSFGNFGQNVLRSAPVYDVDFSLFKRFPFGENRAVEFRAEAFNVLNIQSFGVPGVDIGTPDAGVVSGVADQSPATSAWAQALILAAGFNRMGVKRTAQPAGMGRALGAAVLCFSLASVALCQQTSIASARELLRKGSYEQAVSALQEIVRREPSNAEAHQLLGTVLAIQGNRRDSLEHLLAAVRLEPRSAVAYDKLGVALSHFSELAGARSAFEKAIELDDHLADAHINLSLLLAQSGDYAAAGRQLRPRIRAKRSKSRFAPRALSERQGLQRRA